MDDISTKVHDFLRGSRYDCSSLEELTGGTANFVFRGQLLQPLDDGATTVVVKHTEPYVAANPDFKLTDVRCEFEQVIGTALGALPPSTEERVTISTPRLLHFSASAHTQVYSDLQESIDLKTFLITHELTRVQCERLGRSLGRWVKSFHGWAAAPEQEALRKTMRGSTDMKELKFWLNYGDNLLGVVDEFPEILGPSRGVIESIGKDVKELLGNGEGELVHGDLWCGNILLPNKPLPAPDQPLEMFVIDWELSHIGSQSLDLGQMFGDLYETTYIKGIDAALWLIESIMGGYGPVEDAVAFRVAIQIGAHLVCWGTRKAAGATVEGAVSQKEGVATVGRDFMLKGWEKDRRFFEGTALKYLFA